MHKQRVLSTILFLAFSAGIVQAQTEAQRQKLAEQDRFFQALHQCFNDLSEPEPHNEVFTLSNGKTISTISQNDYARSAFVSADKTLEDIRLWRDSPYLWRMKHRISGKTLSDDRDLSSWEIDNVDKISKQYFESGESTFHIAAHGLVTDSQHTPANKIRIGGQDLDAKETAELILLSMNISWAKHNNQEPRSWNGLFQRTINSEHQPFTIVVHSCHSAVGENNFAQQLSVELAKAIDNVNVVGAPDTVYCEMDANGNYREVIASDYEIKHAANPRQQRWKVYKNGKETGEGDYDYVSTVKKIQSQQ